jgi:hypothetical protein
VRRHGPDALDLVGRDGDAKPRPADQQRPVALPGGDEFRCRCRDVRVGRVVVGADVDDRGDARVGGEVGFDLVLVVDARVLGLSRMLAGEESREEGEGDLHRSRWRSATLVSS